MAGKPKLRIFAGPNGSGKTTLFESIKSIYFSTNFFVNADFLEYNFKKNKFLNLSEFNLKTNDQAFQEFCSNNGLFSKAKFNPANWNLAVKENVIVQNDKGLSLGYNSYHFAIIADFIRYNLTQQKVSFSFETVFSYPSKLHLIDFAHQNSYKIYLYFIGTDTPIMNLERVKDRIENGGHAVAEDKIEKRYFLTMDLLSAMLKKVEETYLWDNSGKKHRCVGYIKKGVAEFSQLSVPNLIDTYILSKV